MKERVEMNNYCAPKEIDLNRGDYGLRAVVHKGQSNFFLSFSHLLFLCFFTRNGEIFKELTDGRLLAGPGHGLQDSGKVQEYTMEFYCAVQETLQSLNTHMLVVCLFFM